MNTRARTHARTHACRVFGIGRWDWRASVGIEVTGTTTTESRRGSDDFGRHRAAWPARSRERLPQKVWAARRVHIVPLRARSILFREPPEAATHIFVRARARARVSPYRNIADLSLVLSPFPSRSSLASILICGFVDRAGAEMCERSTEARDASRLFVR